MVAVGSDLLPLDKSTVVFENLKVVFLLIGNFKSFVFMLLRCLFYTFRCLYGKDNIHFHCYFSNYVKASFRFANTAICFLKKK